MLMYICITLRYLSKNLKKNISVKSAFKNMLRDIREYIIYCPQRYNCFRYIAEKKKHLISKKDIFIT